MVEVKAAILDELDDIEVKFNDGDNTDEFVLQTGYVWPLIKISNTVISVESLNAFKLKLGQSKLPELELSVDDSFNQFRTTDCIDENTEILVWIGSVRSELEPTKLCFVPTDVYARNDTLRLTAVLKVPTDLISIQADTVEEMLKAFCDASGLGLRLSVGDFANIECKRNFAKLTPIQFLDQFCEYLGLQWCIDNYYNVCIYNLPDIIDEYELQTCPAPFDSMDDFEKPVEVRISNKIDDTCLCMFSVLGYDYLNKDNEQPVRANAEFDKSVEIEDDTELISEDEVVDRLEVFDLAKICLELQFNPYLLLNRTFDIQPYTTGQRPKRRDIDSEESKPDEQLLIEDLAGTYLIAAVDYEYPSTSERLTAVCSFVRQPSEETSE